MPASTLRAIVMAIALLTVATDVSGQHFELRAEGSQRWMRGNMHTHSLWSDGDDYPEMIALWYRRQGYQFLVFTDHNVVHRGDKWVTVAQKKTNRQMFDRMVAEFGSDWPVTRPSQEEAGREEVRLKTFDQVFERVAVPQEFLLIQGEEVTDTFQRRPIHLCATNIFERLPPAGGDNIVDVINKNVDLARSMSERSGVATLVHVNHPNFHYAITAEQLMQVEGERFFEVYNGHSGVDNLGDATHVSTERMWDIINTWRLAKLKLPTMYGLATDDGHNYGGGAPGKGAQPGRGWTMVLADTLTPDALVRALEAGRFYSSSGVTLDAIVWNGTELAVDIAEEPDVTYRIDFIGTSHGFDDTTMPAAVTEDKQDFVTRTYSADVGKVLQSTGGSVAKYQFTGSEIYVRAVITSSRKHPNPSQPNDFEQAWIQPVTPK